MKNKLFLIALCIISAYPTLSRGQTIVLTTPSLTHGYSISAGQGVQMYFIGPASSPSLRRYVVQVTYSTGFSQPYTNVTVMDSVAASTLVNLSDTTLQFVGIGDLFDDNHDDLVVAWRNVVATNGIGNGRSDVLKIIDLQTGGTRYTDIGPVNTYMMPVTLVNYSSKDKPEIAVSYTGYSGLTITQYTKVLRFFTLQTGITSPGELNPRTISLSQNYPNPFNPTTTIEYELTQGGTSKLNIFDLNGRVVRSFDLVGEQMGLNRLVWDGRDMAGIPVATGPYFYQLTSGGSVQQKKMLLLR